MTTGFQKWSVQTQRLVDAFSVEPAADSPGKCGSFALYAAFLIVLSLGGPTMVQAQPTSFIASRVFQAGGNPAGLAVGDFNGDGTLDLAVANYGSNNVSVLLSNGDETFQLVQDFATVSSPSSVAAVDFNGDGKLDLAVTNSDSNSVSILLGNGDGTFQAARNFGAGSAPFALAVADFNGDGMPDLAVANLSSNNVSVLLGNGDGTFQTARNVDAGSGPSSVAVGDFNGDRKLDLAVANQKSDYASVLLGSGDGTFQAAPSVGTGARTQPMFVAVSDFNGDGKFDLAVADFGLGSFPGTSLNWRAMAMGPS